MDDDYSTLISNLKFLAHLQKNEKINIKYMTVQSNNFLTSLSRTLFYIDNRQNTLRFISDLMHSTFSILENHENHNNLLITNLISALVASKKGIQNLKYTYQDDIHFACHLDTLVENIDIKLDEIQISATDSADQQA